MAHLLTIPHRRAHGMCPANGIRDLYVAFPQEPT